MFSLGQLETTLEVEAQLLLSCARIELDPACRERVVHLLRQSFSWSHLHREAVKHGLASLIHRHLGMIAQDACPEALWRTWTLDSLGILAHNLRLVAELEALGILLREADIPFLCLKGPALTAALYRDLRLRPSCDLDLVVRPPDARRVCEAFVRRGFVAQFELSGRWWETFLRTRCELTFRRQKPDLLVEVHWGLLPPGYSFTPDLAACWGQVETVCVEKTPVRTLGLEDNLLFLSLHAAKHDWQRLIWLVDLAELLRQRSELDWDRLLTPARMRSAGRQILVSLRLASQLLDAPVPEAVWRRWPPDPRADSLVQRVIDEQLFPRGLRPNAPRKYPWQQLYFQAMRLRRDRLRYLYDVLLQPTPLEWQLLPVPAWLSPVHFVARPIRLLWRHLRRCLRLPRRRRA